LHYFVPLNYRPWWPLVDLLEGHLIEIIPFYQGLNFISLCLINGKTILGLICLSSMAA